MSFITWVAILGSCVDGQDRIVLLLLGSLLLKVRNMLEAVGFVSPFICKPFNDGVSNSEHVVSNDWMIGRFRMEAVVA
jgi:hypothetical protein